MNNEPWLLYLLFFLCELPLASYNQLAIPQSRQENTTITPSLDLVPAEVILAPPAFPQQEARHSIKANTAPGPCIHCASLPSHPSYISGEVVS